MSTNSNFFNYCLKSLVIFCVFFINVFFYYINGGKCCDCEKDIKDIVNEVNKLNELPNDMGNNIDNLYNIENLNVNKKSKSEKFDCLYGNILKAMLNISKKEMLNNSKKEMLNNSKNDVICYKILPSNEGLLKEYFNETFLNKKTKILKLSCHAKKVVDLNDDIISFQKIGKEYKIEENESIKKKYSINPSKHDWIIIDFVNCSEIVASFYVETKNFNENECINSKGKYIIKKVASSKNCIYNVSNNNNGKNEGAGGLGSEEEEEDLDIFALDTVTDKKYLVQVSENTKASRLAEKIGKILNTTNFDIRFKSTLYEGTKILKFEDGDTVYIYPKEKKK